MLIAIIVELKNLENYLKNHQIELAISELKNLKTEQEFTKAYYLFLKYNLDEMIVIKTAREVLKNENIMINEAFEYYYKRDDIENAVFELSKSKDENYIFYQMLRLYSSYGSKIYRYIEKYRGNYVFRKAIFRFLITDNRLDMALKYANDISDSLVIANGYYENGDYNKVVEILKNKNDKFSRRLYGLSLYKIGNYEDASKILEELEPETSAISYMKIGNYQKAIKLTKDTSKIIISLFEMKKYKDVIKFCSNDFYKECFLSYLYTQSPESVINYFKRTFSRARNIDNDIALYVEILNTYDLENALSFFYILKGEKKEIQDKNLESLAYAIYFERKNHLIEAKNYYEKISDSSWIKPFALYKLYEITKINTYKDKLIENYPNSVYSEMIRDK